MIKPAYNKVPNYISDEFLERGLGLGLGMSFARHIQRGQADTALMNQPFGKPN